MERSATSAGPWSVITATPVPGPTATVIDVNLVNGTVYWYRARAVNTGNLYSPYSAPRSEVPGVSATRSSNLVVFFEDMLGSGVNDWDYNDFVVRVASTEMVSGGELTGIAIDYEPLARGAGYVHSFRHHIPVAGAWTATLTRFAVGQPFAGGFPDHHRRAPGRSTSRSTPTRRTPSRRRSAPSPTPTSGQAGMRAGALSRLEITLASPAQNPTAPPGPLPGTPTCACPT